MASEIIERCTPELGGEEDIRWGVFRKTKPALRNSAYQLMLDRLADYHIPYEENKTRMIITIGNNVILFLGLDEPLKIRSVDLNYAWIEETVEIDSIDYTHINMSVRRDNPWGINQLFSTFNPIDPYHWLRTERIDKPNAKTRIHHSGWWDNPDLADEIIEELEALAEIDINLWKIYARGEWGIIKNLVYQNYEVIDRRQFPKSFDETVYAVDFGFNRPAAVLEIGLLSEFEHDAWITECLYLTKLTNADLILKLKDSIPEGFMLYADSAEPARIQEIEEAGFIIFPAVKAVEDGLDFCRRFRFHIDSTSDNLIKEIRHYKYAEDRHGRVLDKPVKFRDHLMDCLRYGLYTHLREARPQLY